MQHLNADGGSAKNQSFSLSGTRNLTPYHHKLQFWGWQYVSKEFAFSEPLACSTWQGDIYATASAVDSGGNDTIFSSENSSISTMFPNHSEEPIALITAGTRSGF